MQTSFGNAVDIGARTDALAKNLVSHKIFLAKLMKECVPEFAGHDPAFIAARCIEGNPEISSIPVNRDELANTRITGMNSEDSSATEQTIRFDIRFRAVVPGTDGVMVIIIHLGTENEENELIGFLNTLFDNSTTAETRKAIMESKYHIAITEDIEKEMSEMCNLSQSIEQRGIEIGEQRGIEIGEQRTLIEALKALISNMGLTKERAMEVLNIPEDQREKLSSLI